MKVIGLAGGSGTGKSMIAAHLVERGAAHIDADKVGHEVLDRVDVRSEVVAAFGERILADGEIDRAKLGRLVFGDPHLLEKLNSIVHPRIIEECRGRIDAFAAQGIDLVVVDAALLLEVPVSFGIDLMIALRADPGVRKQRLLDKGGFSEEQIDARMSHHKHLEDAFDRATVIVDANRPKDVVLEHIDRLIETGLGND